MICTTSPKYPRAAFAERRIELDPTDRTPPDLALTPTRIRAADIAADALRMVRTRIQSWIGRASYPELISDGFSAVTVDKGLTLSALRRAHCLPYVGGSLEGETVAVLGCGYGLDLLTWFPYRPARILAVDVVNYADAWRRLEQLGREHGIEIECIQYDLTQPHWDFAQPGSVRLSSAFQVLEHISDLPTFLAANRELLGAGGVFEAVYGPLWYGPHGDHVYPRSEDRIFNHLLLDDHEYDQYVEDTLSEWEHHDTGMEGPFLLQRGLFSFLRPREYLDAFREASYDVAFAHAVLSSDAQRFRRRNPNAWAEMKRRRQLRDVDLLVKSTTLVSRVCQGASPSRSRRRRSPSHPQA